MRASATLYGEGLGDFLKVAFFKVVQYQTLCCGQCHTLCTPVPNFTRLLPHFSRSDTVLGELYAVRPVLCLGAQKPLLIPQERFNGTDYGIL